MLQFNITLTEKTIGAKTVNAVDAYDIYINLALTSTSFATWVKNLDNFIEDLDFVKLAYDPKGRKQILTKYYVTINTATHLAMMSKGTRAHELRQAYIDAEQELRSLKEACTMAEYNELLARIEQLELAPKAEEYFTMREFLSRTIVGKITTDFVMFNGRAMTDYCREHGIPMHKEYHGSINSNTYPDSALEAWSNLSN